jgi:hypothetical protein
LAAETNKSASNLLFSIFRLHPQLYTTLRGTYSAEEIVEFHRSTVPPPCLMRA